ncbi:hypothetical protein PR048_007460 [Dryococelus australis]|uniref:Uncharacterized protein n=1 Tax=Dryococelus australis TaxID=614101 RepID=A0ABQ9HUK8_9NEOP|nr:hypothetical protein PR048_007460 [Dryococelus australis]
MKTIYNNVKVIDERKPKFKVGEFICISKQKGIFEKNFTENFMNMNFKKLLHQMTIWFIKTLKGKKYICLWFNGGVSQKHMIRGLKIKILNDCNTMPDRFWDKLNSIVEVNCKKVIHAAEKMSRTWRRRDGGSSSAVVHARRRPPGSVHEGKVVGPMEAVYSEDSDTFLNHSLIPSPAPYSSHIPPTRTIQTLSPCCLNFPLQRILLQLRVQVTLIGSRGCVSQSFGNKLCDGVWRGGDRSLKTEHFSVNALWRGVEVGCKEVWSGWPWTEQHRGFSRASAIFVLRQSSCCIDATLDLSTSQGFGFKKSLCYNRISALTSMDIKSGMDTRGNTASKYSTYWSPSCVFIGCCPTHDSYGIRKVFPCKSAIGSEACRAGLINCDPIAKPMRVIEVSMEQRRNEGAGGNGRSRENPPSSCIARHDAHLRKSVPSTAEAVKSRAGPRFSTPSGISVAEVRHCKAEGESWKGKEIPLFVTWSGAGERKFNVGARRLVLPSQRDRSTPFPLCLLIVVPRDENKARSVKDVGAGSPLLRTANRETGVVVFTELCSAYLPFPPPLHSGAASFSPHFTLIGSKDPGQTFPLLCIHECMEVAVRSMMAGGGALLPAPRSRHRCTQAPQYPGPASGPQCPVWQLHGRQPQLIALVHYINSAASGYQLPPLCSRPLLLTTLQVGGAPPPPTPCRLQCSPASYCGSLCLQLSLVPRKHYGLRLPEPRTALQTICNIERHLRERNVAPASDRLQRRLTDAREVSRVFREKISGRTPKH